MLSISAQVRLTINKEEKDFLQHILIIPLRERNWKKLVTLDNLHAFCGKLILTDKARRLDA